MNSCLYRARVRHRRFLPKSHEFEVGTWFLYLDFTEVDAVFSGRWLWSVERFNVVSFRRTDYLEPFELSLDEAVRQRVEGQLGFRPQGPVRLLTMPRVLGVCFNPVSFYYCFEPDGETLAALVSEITNTPWNERRAYVHNARAEDGRGGPFEFKKDFHVSPFVDMDIDYRWIFGIPGSRLSVHMADLQRGAHKPGIAPGDRIFDATMTAERRELTGGALAWVLMRYPWSPVKVLAAIYLQALILFLKRVPFLSHPTKRPAMKSGPPLS